MALLGFAHQIFIIKHVISSKLFECTVEVSVKRQQVTEVCQWSVCFARDRDSWTWLEGFAYSISRVFFLQKPLIFASHPYSVMFSLLHCVGDKTIRRSIVGSKFSHLFGCNFLIKCVVYMYVEVFCLISGPPTVARRSADTPPTSAPRRRLRVKHLARERTYA